MKKQGRYSTSGLVEDQYMPGSKGKVLRNLLGITTKKEIDRVETELLFEITDQLLDEFDERRQFSADDILQIHRMNYEPMEKIFADIIAYSLQIYDE